MGAPFYRETVLPNGLRIVTKRFPGTKFFSLAVVVKHGTSNDPPRLVGLTHLLEHVVHEGTRKWPSSDKVNIQLEILGMNEQGDTSNNRTYFYVIDEKPSRIHRCLRVLSEITLNPLLRKKDIETQKRIIENEHFIGKDRSDLETNEMVHRLLYPYSPWGRPTEGYPETLRKIREQDMIRLHHQYFVPNNMMVVAIGNVYHRQVVKLAKRYFGHLKSKRVYCAKIKTRSISPERRRTVYKSHLDTSYLSVGLRFTDLTPKEASALDMLSEILAGGTLSRLYKLLRTERGDVYAIDISIEEFERNQCLVLSTTPPKAQWRQALDLILQEITNLKTKPITAQELKIAKARLRGEHYRLINLSEHEKFLEELIGSLVDGDVDTHLQNRGAAIQSIKRQDIVDLINKHIDPNNIRVAIIAPRE
ncbi:MAG: pitrilysin family protein [Candidatus Parcubacteria bacterium]|nr:pitrilysin family protein [Candidatus Parcubacteria bacterium]